MQFENYTIKAREALQAAVEGARGRGHQFMEPEHLLVALLEQDGGVARTILQRLEVSPERVLGDLGRRLSERGRVASVDQVVPGDALAAIFRGAEALIQRFGDEYVSTEHLFLALVESGQGAAKVLSEAGVSADRVLTALKDLRGDARVTDEHPEDRYQALERYAQDLTRAARQGKLDPVIGRDDEIRRVIQVLARRKKNNPVLIGDPGVGKTAIIEGLALRMVEHDVPEGLKGKRLVALDLGAMIAGAKYRGEFEDRLKALLKEVTKSDGEIILFIDELHTLVGAGAAQGAMDASNMLKPALARGELHCVGATTVREYRQYIEKDPALERRFQPVQVGEPSVTDAVGILRGLKDKYEIHHGVRIRDAALLSAANLSDRYIQDRFLPDKAIDLIDEACSRLRMQIDSLPVELDQLERRRTQLEIERQALTRELETGGDRERLSEVERAIEELTEQVDAMRARWRLEKETITSIRGVKADIEAARHELDEARRRGDLGRAAELQYGRLNELDQALERENARLLEIQDGQPLLKEEVDEEDVARVVSSWTGIPVQRMLESETTKLLEMEARLAGRVVHQEEAIARVSDAVRRARSGIQDPNRPIGSFLFVGPTGVGKTELVRALAEFLFDDEQAMIRIDMSEYMEKHSVARLIGAPPGYVGHEEGGQLTEAVRRKPYTVVLFDEIEKAHPEVWSALLQLLDDGRLTDGMGRTVDFRNTIVVMTSNVGSQRFEGREIDDALKREIALELKATFRPEFLNRVDETVLFNALRREDLAAITDIQMGRLATRLSARSLTIHLTDAARLFLAERGYDPAFGARPLKRAIQAHVENELARRIIAGELGAGDVVEIDVVGGEDEALAWRVLR